MCGEKPFRHTVPLRCVGSPPHVRGKAHPLLAARVSVGITPACAGKSGWRSCCPGCNRDHPRMCGEKGSYRGFELSLRGKVLCLSLCIDFLGITPAYAGKSLIAPGS